eukprot:gene4196-8345_t
MSALHIQIKYHTKYLYISVFGLSADIVHGDDLTICEIVESNAIPAWQAFSSRIRKIPTSGRLKWNHFRDFFSNQRKVIPDNYNSESPLSPCPSTASRNYAAFGILSSLAKRIDSIMGDWWLSYADTTPYNEKTSVGLLFLATNICYITTAIDLWLQSNNILLSLCVATGGLASLNYHTKQINLGPNNEKVHLALLIDYIFAFITIACTVCDIGYLFTICFLQHSHMSWTSIIYGTTAAICLVGSWVYGFGLPYLVLHGLWHVLSARTASIIGFQLHNL